MFLPQSTIVMIIGGIAALRVASMVGSRLMGRRPPQMGYALGAPAPRSVLGMLFALVWGLLMVIIRLAPIWIPLAYVYRFEIAGQWALWALEWPALGVVDLSFMARLPSVSDMVGIHGLPSLPKH